MTLVLMDAIIFATNVDPHRVSWKMNPVGLDTGVDPFCRARCRKRRSHGVMDAWFRRGGQESSISLAPSRAEPSPQSVASKDELSGIHRVSTDILALLDLCCQSLTCIVNDHDFHSSQGRSAVGNRAFRRSLTRQLLHPRYQSSHRRSAQHPGSSTAV